MTDAPLFANILCGIDGTRASTAAVRMATCLAGPEGHLTLLAVTAVAGAGVHATAAIGPSRVRRVLDRAKRIADAAGEAGRVACADHDLLALGAPATSWLGGMLIGGVADVTLSRFTTPTLFVRASFAPPLRGREIMVASDGLDGSDRIVELAGALARDQHAAVTLVHALGSESRMHPHRIAAQVDVLERSGVGVRRPLIEPGRAVPVILAAVKSTKAAIVVIGSRRLGGLARDGADKPEE